MIKIVINLENLKYALGNNECSSLTDCVEFFLRKK